MGLRSRIVGALRGSHSVNLPAEHGQDQPGSENAQDEPDAELGQDQPDGRLGAEQHDGELGADKPRQRGSEDLLGRLPFASRIALLIADRTAAESLVIAIYGPWGDGKTSVVNFVEDRLQAAPDVVFVRFNPWIVEDRDALLRSFFETVAAGLGDKLDTPGEELAGTLRRYSGYLAPVLSPIPGLGGSIESLNRVTAGVSTKTIEEYKDRISAMLATAGKRVVVSIDDIDRLDRSEIAALLKLVRLVADFDRTVYLLAFDRRVVAEALSGLYPGSADEGSSFLEKIVQVPLPLPPSEGDSLERLALNALDRVLVASSVELTDEENSEFGLRFRDGIAAGIATPRAAIQYANAVAFALPMLSGEANLVDVISVEALRSLYPGVYQFVKENADLVLGTGAEVRSTSVAGMAQAQELWNDAIKTLSVARRRSARVLATALFPRLPAALGDNNHYGPEWTSRWAAAKRVASPDHFERFFTYHVAKGQVSEVSVDAFLGDLQVMDDETARETIAENLEAGKGASLVRYLRLREEELTTEPAKRLALALAESGDLLDRPLVMFSFSTPFEQTAILISRLIGRVPRAERSEFAHTIVARARPLPFAAHILRWIRTKSGSPESERVLDEGGERRAAEEVAARIANDAVLGATLYEKYPLDAALLLWVWARYGEPDACRNYTARTLAADSKNAVLLLKAYLPTAFSMGTGRSHPSDFEREQFDAVQAVVDPELIARSLRIEYPDLSIPDEYPATFDVFSDRRLAEQFLYVYAHVADVQDEAVEDAPNDDASNDIVVTPDQEA
jgi:hypothetical protein